MSNGTTVQGTRDSNYLYAGFNHHLYANPEDAVYVALGKNKSHYLNPFSVLSIEQAEQIIAALTEVVDEFRANEQTILNQANDLLKVLPVGSIIQCGPKDKGGSWAQWVKRSASGWEVFNSTNPGFIGTTQSNDQFFKYDTPTVLPTVIFDATLEAF